MRILVVDDEPAVLGFVSRVLRDAGYDTTVAISGPQAMTSTESFDQLELLLTDFRMPEMTGLELAKAMRPRRPGLKVLYLTGYSDALFNETAALSDEEAFLEKPVSPTALLEAVSLLMFGHMSGPSPRSNPS